MLHFLTLILGKYAPDFFPPVWHWACRCLLAALTTLPALDVRTLVPYEFSGQRPCCFSGCAEAGRYVHTAKPYMALQSAMVLELVDAALQVIEPIGQRTAAW